METGITVTWATGEQMEQELIGADQIVMEFSRREVDAGTIGDALDRLLSISDSKRYMRKYQGKISFTFAGYTFDRREIYEIPEVVAFFRTLTQQWPYWFHFLERTKENFQMLFSLLCDVKQVKNNNGQVGFVFQDEEQVGVVIKSMFLGLNKYYEAQSVSEEDNETISRGILKTIDALFTE